MMSNTLFSKRPTLIELRDGQRMLGRLYTRHLSNSDDSPHQFFRAAADPIVPRNYEPSSLQIYFDGLLVYDCDLSTGQKLQNQIDPALLAKLLNGEEVL
jgi:hypothetical protein